MHTDLYSALERIASIPRLSRYRASADTDFDVVALYCWNIALAESLMPAIAILEVTLRNSVHRTITNLEGTEWWFQEILNPRSLAIIEKIQRDLERRSGVAPSVGKVIAEINFGFWPKLFAKSYHKFWWRYPDRPLAQVLAFHPNVARDTRATFEMRLEYFAALRNRVMHQEAVFDGVTAINRPRMDLDTLHHRLLETIGWLDQDALSILMCLDRYPDVASEDGRQHIVDLLRRL